MSDLINREDAIKAMYRLEAEDIERYECFIPEGFHAKPAVEALKALPSVYPETITIEEVSNQLGCATIQSALYWFEFLKTLDLLGFAIVRKKTR